MEDIAEQLKAALEECARLRQENKRLRSLLDIQDEKYSSQIAQSLSSKDKVTLFRSLFRGREDVFPVRWEARTGSRTGYSPACANEWRRPFCAKPRIRCKELIPLRFFLTLKMGILGHFRQEYRSTPGQTITPSYN